MVAFWRVLGREGELARGEAVVCCSPSATCGSPESVILESMAPQLSDDTRRQIVDLYTSGVPLAEIIKVTGTTSIYTTLRREGIEPSRHIRMRDPEVRREREAQARQSLRDAASATGTDSLRIIDYRLWRSANPHGPHESVLTRLFGSWTKAVHAAGLRPGYVLRRQDELTRDDQEPF